MCVEQIQKILIASILGMVLMLVGVGSTGPAFLLQFILMIVLLMSAFTGKCIITNFLSLEFPPCKKKDNEEDK